MPNTPDLRIQQAVALAEPRGVKVMAQSDDLDTAELERIAVLFGTRPAGVRCPLAHFACPFGKSHVAIVRVEDRPGSGDPLGFRFLVLGRELYGHLGDPFAISDRYPPNWNASGTLPDLAWPVEVLPERTVEQLDAILKAGDVSLLLGGTQALIDGNTIRLQRDEPAESLVRGLWQLLPNRDRQTLWPASFAFSDELGFHLAALPVLSVLPNKDRARALTEEAVRDYPPSKYELSLQIAVESADRVALRALLNRRTADDTIRLGLYILGFALLAALIARFVM